MKTRVIPRAVLITLLVLFGHCGFSQGTMTFVDLNFESPVPPLNPNDPFGVAITNALPGWTGYVEGNQVDRVGYNSVTLDAPYISLHDSLSPFVTPLDGNYSVFLQGGSSSSPIHGAAIAQTGQVPASAQSLMFLASFPSLEVTFGGQPISLVNLGNSPNYGIYGGDISMFAGQTGELRFAWQNVNGILIDDITFSTTPIPEPGAFGLFALGGLFLGRQFRNNLKR